MNLLITGGAGYLGIHVLFKLLKNKNLRIFIIDNFSNSNPNILNKISKRNKNRIILNKIDINDTKKLTAFFKINKIDYIIHLAAKINAHESLIKEKLYMQYNYIATKNLFKLANKYKVKKFLFSSSAAVYGNVKSKFCLEHQKKYPINPYGLSKLKSENYIINNSKNTKYCIIRIFNLFGFKENFYKFFRYRESIYFKLLNKSKKKNKSLTVSRFIFNSKYYTTQRDFIHVDDVANIFVKLISMKKSNIIINCGTGNITSILTLIKYIETKFRVNFLLKFKKKRLDDPFSVIASTKLFKKYFKNYKMKKIINKKYKTFDT